MAHKTYLDTVRALASGAWGRDFPTNEAAQRSLLESVDLTGACSLAILNRIDMFLEALASSAIDNKIQETARRANAWIKKALESDVEKHGPVPDSVRRWFGDEVDRDMGRQLRYGRLDDGRCFFVRPPVKGSEARKDWDKWKRRKAKEAQPGQQGESE